MRSIIFLLALCVVTFADDTINRIKGGSAAAPGEFPYQVSVRIGKQHICGGALVTLKHVLTAGSCIVRVVRNPKLIEEINVVVGSNDLLRGGFRHKVSKITLHPEYQWNQEWSSYVNDIGVIHLSVAAKSSAYVKQIDLPGITEVPRNAPLLFSGWGNVKGPQGPSSVLLQKAQLYAISTQQCQKFANINAKQYQICTLPNNNVGTCTTDQGSPLVYRNQLVGISTRIHGCAGGTPDVFTKVSYYLKFIVDEMNVVISK